MYEYNICNKADEEIFIKQCMEIEKNIPEIKKLEILTDVDESKIQKYLLNGKEVKVYNSYYIDAIYIESEIELTRYFN